MKREVGGMCLWGAIYEHLLVQKILPLVGADLLFNLFTNILLQFAELSLLRQQLQ
jgi:hypothetical protein